VVLVRKRDGARQIVFMPSTSPEPVFDPDIFKGARLLHLNGRHENTCRGAIAAAQAQNIDISFDGGAGRFRESIRDLFESSHLRIVSRDFAEKCAGSTDLAEVATRLLQPPARLLVITEGTLGSHVWTPDGVHFHQPAFKAEPLIDTTGCGDVFHGAFLHGWLSQWPLWRCAEHASRIAAKNAEGLGGRHVLKTVFAL
jgi:sugar/nucleoside kinase (ribokinase family)